MRHLKRKTPQWESMYDMAWAIANKRAKGLDYCDDAAAEGYVAVAQGATRAIEVHNAIRNSLRQQWARERRFRSLEISDSITRQEPPERARPDIWEALAALDERQRLVVILTFWEDLDQDEIGEIIGVQQPRVCKILARALYNMKIFFDKKNNPGGSDALYQ